MTLPYIDTDLIIRLLTGDDREKQTRAAALFKQIEQRTLIVAAPDTVIADCVFVLSSPRLYKLPRDQVAALLTPLVKLTGFRVKNRQIVLSALVLYGSTSGLDFGDAMIIASMCQSNSSALYSFDADFDKIPGIIRQEP